MSYFKSKIFISLLIITVLSGVFIWLDYRNSNTNEQNAIEQNADANWLSYDKDRKNLESIITEQKETLSKESDRLRRSVNLISNYTSQIEYAQQELNKNFDIINCNIDNKVLQNQDFGLKQIHNSDFIDFKINNNIGYENLILQDIRHGDMKSFGIIEIAKSNSIIEVTTSNRINEEFLNVNLIGTFQSENGICEERIKITFAPDNSIKKTETEIPIALSKKEKVVTNDELNAMREIEWRYAVTADEIIKKVSDLSIESKSLLGELEKISSEVRYNTSKIMTLSRTINYAKQMLNTNENIQFCYEENFHLRNVDFNYDDLFQGETINLGFSDNYTKDNLILLNIKLKELKHAGIATLASDSQGYSIRLNKKYNKMEAIELTGSFKKSSGEQCVANIRLTFFPSKVDMEFLNKFESVSVLGKIGNDSEEFQLPYGSAFYNDALFTTDCINAKIQVFDKSGRFLYSFGERGTHSGQIYTTPADVQVHNGSVYIAEGSNHRIEQFSLSGDFEKSWGTYGYARENPTSELGKFNIPFGLDFVDNMMIVSEHFNYRVQALDTISGKTRWVSGNSEGDKWDWMEPYYLKVDHERELIYVVARVRNYIGVLNFQGEKLYTFGNEVLDYPHEIDVGPDGKIYIADSKNYRVVIYDSPESDEYEVIQFTPNFGYLKTVSVDYDGSLALGFNNGKVAYVLLLSTTEAAQKKPGPKIIEAQKKVIEKNRTLSEITLDETVMMRTERLYTQNCAGCHENGSFGAPTRGDLASWEKFTTDRKTLLSLAFSGNGAMMPKGGCDECTADDLNELITYIAPMNWLTGKQ